MEKSANFICMESYKIDISMKESQGKLKAGRKSWDY